MLPTENPWPAMIALVCIAIIFLVQWGATRKLSRLIIGLVSLLLGGGCFLLDQLVQTPTEIIVQNIYDMTSAFQKEDVPKTLSYFSPRAKERAIVESTMKGVHVGDDLRISDVSVTFKAANSIAISHFRANATVSLNVSVFGGSLGYRPSRWELEWEREAGEWKVVKVHRLHPITGKEVHFMAAD